MLVYGRGLTVKAELKCEENKRKLEDLWIKGELAKEKMIKIKVALGSTARHKFRAKMHRGAERKSKTGFKTRAKLQMRIGLRAKDDAWKRTGLKPQDQIQNEKDD